MDKIFIQLVPGLEGQIGKLIIEQAHERDTSEIPINFLEVDLAKELEIEEENRGN